MNTDPSGMNVLTDIGNFFNSLGLAIGNFINPPCGSDFCTTTTSVGDINTVSASLAGGLTGGGGASSSGGDGTATYSTTSLGKADVPTISTPPIARLQAQKTGNPPLTACGSAILNAVNERFKTQFTDQNVPSSSSSQRVLRPGKAR